MNKFQETFNKWAEVNTQLHNDCTAYLKEVLAKLPNNAVEIDNETAPCCITYDGGNHPEFDANPYSQVERVYLNYGRVYIDTEDADGIMGDYINAMELHEVANAVEAMVAKDFDLED